MTDTISKERRSANMASIRGKDTKPELIVRSIIHSMGYRYTLHNYKLPGKPDIVLTRHKKIILVNGCFWHMHTCPNGRATPKTHKLFWKNKRVGNVNRDRKNRALLRRSGWQVLVIWECWTEDIESMQRRLSTFLKQ